MTHEEMMNKAWRFLQEVGITEDPDEFAANRNLYLVENIYQVRDAYCADLESGEDFEDEDVAGFLDRHGIKWQ
jgi:hypothetical protein